MFWTRSATQRQKVNDLPNHLGAKPLYETRFGPAFLADSLSFMAAIPKDEINLVITSPPYALHFKKEYGNADQRKYLDWFIPFAREVHSRLLINA